MDNKTKNIGCRAARPVQRMMPLYDLTDGRGRINVGTAMNVCHQYDGWCAMVGFGGLWVICDVASPRSLSKDFGHKRSLRTYIPTSTRNNIDGLWLNYYLFPSNFTVTSQRPEKLTTRT